MSIEMHEPTQETVNDKLLSFPHPHNDSNGDEETPTNDKRVYMGTEQHSVEFTLTEKELADYAKEVDVKLNLINSKEIDIAGHQAHIKDLKEDSKTLMREVQSISFTRSRGTEFRHTECDIYFDYEKGTKEVYSPVSGELVASRELTSNEKQITMFASKKKELRA